jgi:hypothetical protein
VNGDWQWWQVAAAVLAYWVVAAGGWIARSRWAARHGRLPIVAQRETAEGLEITLAARLDLRRVAAVALAPVAAVALILMWTARG